jgi:hypothetical protein
MYVIKETDDKKHLYIALVEKDKDVYEDEQVVDDKYYPANRIGKLRLIQRIGELRGETGEPFDIQLSMYQDGTFKPVVVKDVEETSIPLVYKGFTAKSEAIEAIKAYTVAKFAVTSKSVTLPGEEGRYAATLAGGVVAFKETDGTDGYRWVSISSTAFLDKDREIISTKALENAVKTMEEEDTYGPLRWWHTKAPPIDIGQCDFSAVHSHTLIESGTFIDSELAEKIMSAGSWQTSIGFEHPPEEPDSEGVFNRIKIFERSLVPAGKAANPMTAILGDKDMDTKKLEALTAILGEDMVNGLLSSAEAAETAAKEQGVAFKETTESLTLEDISSVVTTAVSQALQDFFSEVEAEEEEVEEETETDTKEEQEVSPDTAAILSALSELAVSIKESQQSLTAATAANEAESEVPSGFSGGYRATQDNDTVVSGKSVGRPGNDSGLDYFVSKVFS